MKEHVSSEIRQCLCGTTPIMYEDYDVLQIMCPCCGRKGLRYFGDYYDESFMRYAYEKHAVVNWNQEIEEYSKNLWFYGTGERGDVE